MNFKSGLRVLAAGVALVGSVTTAMATPFPGPDAFVYSGANIPFNFRDISAAGTQAFGGADTDDSVTGAVPIGFAFSFYGTPYTSAYIGSNGFITFSPGQLEGCCNGGPLPGTTTASNLVAGWFTDLVSGSPGVGDNIYYQTLGSAGSREFIVEYLNNPYFFNTPNSNTFEIILHEGTNDIELQYNRTSADGHTRSVGIENLGGTIGLQAINDNTSLLNRQGLCISTGSTSCPTNAVPEPGSLAMASLSLLIVGAMRRKRKQNTGC